MSLEKIKNSIVKAANDVLTLQIRTIVGPVTYDEENQLSTTIDTEKLDQTTGIITTIDLIDGDITTKMDEEFANGDYQNLRSFHLDKEEQGRDIIKNNIEILKDLYAFFKTMKDDDSSSNNT